MNPLQRAIKKTMEENCKKGIYAERFSPEFQREMKLRGEELAILASEDEDLLQALDLAIEDAMRITVLKER